MSDTQIIPAGFTEYLSVQQVAAVLGVSHDLVTKQFAGAEGVIDLGTKEKMNRRRKRCLRISRTALQRFIESRQTKRTK